MNQATAPQDARDARSPFAGCAILITAVLVMVFLIGFSTLTLFRQFDEIAKFTAEKPTPVEIASLEDREAELNKLAERLENFRQQLTGDEASSLALSADDLNLAIAAFEAFKELRGTFHVTRIEKETLRVAISFPLNGKPRLSGDEEPGWFTTDSRYLNATLVARPRLLKNEVVLTLDAIEVPGVEVPSGFLEQMSPYRINERYLTDPLLGPAMAKLTRVEISDGKIQLFRNPGEVPADHITDSAVDSASTRLFTALGIAAAVFLAFAGTIVFIGVRAKSKRPRIN
ncbi:MAG: hypothetical protein WED15_03950 [Akkermansiaceae bacterium]